MSIMHAPWLAREIHVVESRDPTLVGVTGMIVEETRRTVSYTHLTLPTKA